MTRVSAVLKTNLPASSCDDQFLTDASNFLANTFDTDGRNIVLEVHTDVRMMRDGSTEPAMNVDVHHNAGEVNKSRRVKVAEDLAQFVLQRLHIPDCRTLVLFFDTKKCT